MLSSGRRRKRVQCRLDRCPATDLEPLRPGFLYRANLRTVTVRFCKKQDLARPNVRSNLEIMFPINSASSLSKEAQDVIDLIHQPHPFEFIVFLDINKMGADDNSVSVHLSNRQVLLLTQ